MRTEGGAIVIFPTSDYHPLEASVHGWHCIHGELDRMAQVYRIYDLQEATSGCWNFGSERHNLDRQTEEIGAGLDVCMIRRGRRSHDE